MSRLALFKSRFARDSAILQVGGMLNAGGNLLSSVAMAFVLGAREQGDFYTAQALYALFFFALNLGAVQATVSQVAAASARGLSEKIANWLAFLAKTYLGAGLALLAVGWFVLPQLAGWQYHNRQFGTWAYLLCLTPILEMPKVVVCAALQGTRRMLPLAQIENGGELCRVVLVISGSAIRADPYGPIFGTLLASLVGSVLAIDMYRSVRREGGVPLPGVRDIARRIRGIPLREGLPLGLRLGVIRNIDALSLDVLPPLVIQYFGGVQSSESVTYFRIAQRIMRLPMMLLQGMARTTLPVISEFAGRRDYRGMRKVWLRASAMSGAASLLAAGALLLVVPWLVQLFYPRDYAVPVWNIALVLSLAVATQGFQVAFDGMYIAVDRLRVAIAVGLGGAVVYLALLAALTRADAQTGPAWAQFCGVFYSNLNFLLILRALRQLERERQAPAPVAATAGP